LVHHAADRAQARDGVLQHARGSVAPRQQQAGEEPKATGVALGPLGQALVDGGVVGDGHRFRQVVAVQVGPGRQHLNVDVDLVHVPHAIVEVHGAREDWPRPGVRWKATAPEAVGLDRLDVRRERAGLDAIDQPRIHVVGVDINDAHRGPP
jgi:hypothetical protein